MHTGYSSVNGYDGINQDPSNPNDTTWWDNCGLEVENIDGFTISELHDNAWAAGLDWLSITDHSYCIDIPNGGGVNEWNHIQQEVNTYSYPNNPEIPVLLFRSEELSVDETSAGYWDELFCGGGGATAHLGAHSINDYMQGGVCWNQPWTTQTAFSEVERLGGFSIINHPNDMNWDWESENDTSGETGVEIWNGRWDTDQHNVDFWIRRLLRGDHTFAFGGSDTHDSIEDSQVFNATYIEECIIHDMPPYAQVPNCFTRENLVNALKNGRIYVSNGPALALFASTYYNAYGLMGDTVTVGEIIDDEGNRVLIKVYYNLGNVTTNGTIKLYAGNIVEKKETVTEIELTEDDPSEGTMTFGFSIVKDHYFRAEYVSSDGEFRAYTNPIWVESWLFVEKNADGAPWYPNQEITYTITYSNGTDMQLTDVVIEDWIHYDSFVSATGGGTYDPETRSVTWELGTLEPGDAGILYLTVRIPIRDCMNRYVNGIEIYSDEVFGNYMEVIHGIVSPCLSDPPSFKKTVSSSDAYRGDVLEFTLEINNLGNASAFNVTWTDHQPLFIDYIPGTTRFELYDENDILKSSGNAFDPKVIHNDDGTTTLIFENIVPEIGAGEMLKIFYESKISENAPFGITLENEAKIESYSDEEENAYADGASASASVTIIEPNQKYEFEYSLKPLAYNTIHKCCIPAREKAYKLLSKAKERNLETKEVELLLKEADSLLEKAKAFYESGNYIASNNYALKACELYKKAIELLERILGLWG